MPLTLYKTFAWQTFASLRLFTCLVYINTYCVPIAHLHQNKPFSLLAQIISEFLMCSSHQEIVKQVLSHTQMKCVGNITVLVFSLTASRRKQHLKKYKEKDQDLVAGWDSVWVSNFVLPNLHIWVCGKIARHRLHLQVNFHAKCNVLEKTLCNFFVIEKHSSEEGM